MEREHITLRDVAREAGVSYATASRALNGSDRTVRKENADRVRAAADRLGYAPDLSAQAIARGSSSTVALVVNDIDDPYFSSIAAGVTEAAQEAGLIVTMAIADRSPGLELQIVRTLRGHRPRAVIIAGTRTVGSDAHTALIDELSAYHRSGGRVALISQPELPFTTLSVDNYGGAHRLATALAGAGYRRFAIVHAGDDIRTSADRRQGFTDGIHASGLTVDAADQIVADFTRTGGNQAAAAIASRRPEAVFAVNDVMAIGLMSGLRDAGRTPGADIAVAGFDDIAAAVDVLPPLTTVRVPLHDLGRQALELALASATASRVDIPVELVLRESTPQAHAIAPGQG
ncbi:LacI family DNA-binding transcriptional regulator [Actinoplanes flavus]|uniref:LacI family DNA-binding transcriptional regulator n=1 Tax=Actinoplanes flavus TaxID=2820290 RepID=A0ABS3UWX7_9ACTN|nr:LacI family DNA-binding transcriptional regulator [Actinoplanes flavus]MBO3743088.1 LacI family DNA-binding transcriptional regulator [Actinoplanes flavus]